MHFDLSDDHQMLRRMVRDFVAARVTPNAAAWGEAGAVPAEVLRAVAELGLLGVRVPEDAGGAGMDATALALALEEVAAGDAGLASVLASHALCCEHLMRAGTGAQIAAWAARLAAGEVLGTWAAGGTDAEVAYARGVRRGSAWTLDGQLPWVVAGGLAQLVVAVVATGPSRGTAFLLPAGPGVVALDAERPLGLRSSRPAHLQLMSDADVPDTARLGAPGAGFETERALLPLARIARAAIAVGVGRAALDAALAYAAERTQFGKPLSAFQAMQWMIADSATELDAARLLVRRAAHLLDEGDDAAGEAAMARLFAVRAAEAATDRALQMHGGYGYTTEYPVERLWRDARQCEVGEGSSSALHQRVVAGDLLGGVR
jgi:alkylation response protein AidB-like acyl-CoA dehydrogenase